MRFINFAEIAPRQNENFPYEHARGRGGYLTNIFKDSTC